MRALDGLRAIAVLLVLIQHGFFVHVSPYLFDPGPIGVRLFFVLSGFLITTILLDARTQAEADGVSMWVVWRAFLARRAVRIFPLAYLVIAIAWIHGVPAMRDHAWWYLTYVCNLGIAFTGQLGGTLSLCWSLAVEEHFYLFWPLLLLFAPRTWWRPVTLTLLGLAALLRAYHVAHDGLIAAYVLTWCRMDALALGALLAIQRPRLRTLLILAAGSGLVAGALSSSLWLMFAIGETAMVLLSGAVLLLVLQGYTGRLLSLRPVVAIGSISYGVYLWGNLVQDVLVPAVFSAVGSVAPMYGWRTFLLTTALTILMAHLSWRRFERPLNDLKRFFPYVPDTAHHVKARAAA